MARGQVRDGKEVDVASWGLGVRKASPPLVATVLGIFRYFPQYSDNILTHIYDMRTPGHR